MRLEEFAALRATIRERGTARVWFFWAGLVGWATIVVVETAINSLPVLSLVPLLVLAATFEGVFALHTGVERVGRYLQVMFEETREPGDEGLRWETAAMAFGRLFPARGPDPLFSGYFVLAAVLNLIPVALAGPVPAELGLLGVIHLIFIVRLFRARSVAAGQRARDLERFRLLAREVSHTTSGSTGSSD
ncbi:MAG: hypothetical protein KGN76_17800 [Acidobacteriota bacterium]|nr:hypothetical protein [Acidobacteriota bacterium]